MTVPPSTNEALTVSVDDLAARLPNAERLRIAEALVAAAFALCPKKDGGEYLERLRHCITTLGGGAAVR